MNNVNLKKLAEELNLSVSTVSRALRDSHEISEKTKERVKDLAGKHGFQPNPYASSLRQSKSKTIAVVIPEIENNFFSQVMNGVEAIAQKKGYHVLIYLTHEDLYREKDILQLLRNGRVDGVLISLSNSTNSFEHLQAYKNERTPLVFFDRICETIDVPRITTDDSAAAFTATEHLLQRGCRNIVFLSMSSDLSITRKRRQGYKSALAKYGAADRELCVECSSNDEENRKKIRTLLQKKRATDGIFAAVEKLAINTYQVCHELKIEIPRDLKVISFSNLSAAALFDPPLSTIVQPAYEIGKESSTVLFKIIEKKILLPTEKNIAIPSYIVERKSTSQ